VAVTSTYHCPYIHTHTHTHTHKQYIPTYKHTNSKHVNNQSALESIHLRSPGGSTFVFRYYSLRGDTAMPGEIYARLCTHF